MEVALNQSRTLTSGEIYKIARLAHDQPLVDVAMSLIAGSIQNPREMSDVQSKNMMIRMFRRTGEWDKSFFCFLIRKFSKGVFFVIRGFAPYVAAVELGIETAKAKIVALDMDELTDEGIRLLSVYLQKADKNAFFYQAQETVIGQIYTMSTLLREYLQGSSKTLTSKFSPQELLGLYPEDMHSSSNKTFVASMDEKKNRGALRLIRLQLAEKLYQAECSSLDPKLQLIALRNLASPHWSDDMILHVVKDFLERGIPLNNFSRKKQSSASKKIPKMRVPKRRKDNDSFDRTTRTSKRPAGQTKRREEEEFCKDKSTSTAAENKDSETHVSNGNNLQESLEVQQVELLSQDDKILVDSALPIHFKYRSYNAIITSQSFNNAMESRSMICDDLILFGAQCLLGDICSISFCPDVCRRTNLIINRPETHFRRIYDENTKYIAVLVANALHFSLVLCFGFREAVDWILSFTPDPYFMQCPMMIIHLDSLPTRNHYDLVQKHIVPWFKQLLEYEARRTNRDISMASSHIRESDNHEQTRSARSVRLDHALRVFYVNSVPIQAATSNECGWNVLRYLMLLKDSVLKKDLFLSAHRDSEIETMSGSAACHVKYVLRKNEISDRAFRCVSIGQVQKFIRHELVRSKSELEEMSQYNLIIKSWSDEVERIVKLEKELERDAKNISKRSVVRLRPKLSSFSETLAATEYLDPFELKMSWRHLRTSIQHIQNTKDQMNLLFVNEDVDSYFSRITEMEKLVSSFLQDY